jgi:hypothetical protein
MSFGTSRVYPGAPRPNPRVSSGSRDLADPALDGPTKGRDLGTSAPGRWNLMPRSSQPDGRTFATPNPFHPSDLDVDLAAAEEAMPAFRTNSAAGAFRA